MFYTLPKNTKKVNPTEDSPNRINIKTSKKLFYFLLALILLRPSLDIVSQVEFQIHSNLPYFNLNTIIGGLVFLICLIFCLENLKNIYQTPLFYPIFFFLGLCFASIFYSIEPLVSIREFVRLASIFLLYFLTYQLVKDKKDWFLLLKIILISYILPAIFAIIQLIGGSGLLDDFGGFSRIYGTFAHPNSFAFYTFFILGLVLCIVLMKSFWNSGFQKDSRLEARLLKMPSIIYLQIFAAVLTFLLFATYTRSAIACLFIFILVFGFFRYKKLLLAGLLLFLIAYFVSDIFQQRFWELIVLDPYGSVVWRFRLWQDIIPISLWQPLFGYGLDTFANLVEFYRGFKWGSLEAHNDYLKIFVENGIVGLCAYLWLIIALLLRHFKIFRKITGEEKVLALGILFIYLSLFAASFFDNILRITALQWNLWIMLGAWLKINNR